MLFPDRSRGQAPHQVRGRRHGHDDRGSWQTGDWRKPRFLLSPCAVVKYDSAMTKPNFKNRTLWTGDNLDIMRGLNSETVDLIYLDPPFNSNKTYSAPIGSKAAGAAFKDTWTLSDVDLAWHGEIAEANPSLYRVIDAAREAHGKGMQSYLIMMAVRLLEMKRLLKPTGSVYLHCDPTASHYLKLLMDTVFGARNFRNEITWQRTESHNTAEKYGNIADILLFYSMSESPTWNRGFHKYSGTDQKYSEQQMKRFRHVDAEGRRYRLDDLTAPRPDSDSGKFNWRGTMPSPSRGWGYRLGQLEEWWAEGRIHTKRDGTPRMDGLKVYLDDSEGKALQNIWTDIPRISNTSSERIGYPTQKPLALLERIIRSSSNEGDMVIDPFCGCATALVAGEKLEREWVGIDISPKARDLVKVRMEKELGLFSLGTVYRDDVPMRTDLGELPHYRTHKHTLFGKQEGHCAGCRHDFPFRNFTVDHIVSQSKGGTDHIDNLQLLCNACNSMKGTKTQEEFLAALMREGIR